MIAGVNQDVPAQMFLYACYIYLNIYIYMIYIYIMNETVQEYSFFFLMFKKMFLSVDVFY